MNAKKSKKVLLLASLSTLAVSTAAVLAISFNSDSAFRAKAATGVSSSIVFSRDSGTFTKIDSNTASVSGTSFTGATYYAVSRNNGDVSSTNYIAQFGFGKGYNEMYVSFSTSKTGTDDFEFESITGIKITTTSSTSYNFYAYYGESFGSYVAVAGSSSPTKVSFETPLTKLRVGVGSVPVQAKYITSIELFYDCGVKPEPVNPDHIFVANGPKQFEYGSSFVESEIYMSYSDKSIKQLTYGLTFSGYDPEVLGDQTISVSYDGPEGHFETSYTVNVYIATLYSISYKMYDASASDWEGEYVDIHDFIDDVDALPPSFEEGTDVEMEINLSTDEYEAWGLFIEEDQDWDSFSTLDGVNFTLSNLPDDNITIVIVIGPVE